jgi:CDP-glucose 4,6-dehydratase
MVTPRAAGTAAKVSTTPMADILGFYKGKKVFLTGHTGFKGSWLSRILALAGAAVTGYALDPPTDPSLWGLLAMEGEMASIKGDVRDFASLKKAFDAARPEIAVHMAAQPLVREGYASPALTYETNVMGTVNLLECARLSGSVRSVLNVTTDKAYRNNEWPWGYREEDVLDGLDPYGNSKSCSELATETYARSFLAEKGVAVSTARSGNVIGGGDFAKGRIIPDCVRAARGGWNLTLRNPGSTRPYQHVLEALGAYLLIARRQYENPGLAGPYNVGPDDGDCVSTGELAAMFREAWGGDMGIECVPEADAPREAFFLKLDHSKIKSALGWEPRWGIKEAVARTAEWEKTRAGGGDLRLATDRQIDEYFKN